jgi:signal transduction histidine kinase
MKIGARFAASLAVPLVALTAVFGILYDRHSRTQLRAELAREGRAVAYVLKIAAEDYLQHRQPEELRDLVERISGYERVLGARVFDRSGELRYQSPDLNSLPFRQREALARVLQDRLPAENWRRVDDQSVGGFIFPLVGSDTALLGAVQVLQLESFIEEDARASRSFMVLLTVSMVIATTAMVLAMTRLRITQPIGRFIHSLREVAGGDLQARVRVQGDDEVCSLAREFNHMCGRLEAAQQSLLAEADRRRQAEARLRTAERLASVGRLAAGLAHEIGTPLNVISGRAESLQRAATPDSTTERHLRVIATQIDRIVRIVRDMLNFARSEQPRRAPIQIAQVIRRVLELMEPRFEQGSVTVRTAFGDALPDLPADADQLHQVFLNLFLNAVDAMPDGGRLTIRAEQQLARHHAHDPQRPTLAVTVADTGSGIPLEHRDRIFDPFFTTKDVGRGTGLGLSVSHGIVEEHDGWFEVDSAPDRGTQITVFLPLDPREAAAPEPAVAEAQ